MEVDLTPSEEELLLAIGETNGYSLTGHYSKQEIVKRLSDDTRKNAAKMRKINRAFKKLRSKQMIQIKPADETTYTLTRNGLNYLRRLIDF
ncbi:MAG: hypothetical protein ACW99Q_20720 [Candidatus Kariarchaeaceae archaeon]|jgi:hypothetical protein